MKPVTKLQWIGFKFAGIFDGSVYSYDILPHSFY